MPLSQGLLATLSLFLLSFLKSIEGFPCVLPVQVKLESSHLIHILRQVQKQSLFNLWSLVYGFMFVLSLSPFV